MADPLFLGIDLGTSALKCGVWTSTGRRSGAARIPYPTFGPHASEQDAENWWRALVLGARSALARVDGRRVEGLGVGGHAPSPVFVDPTLSPVSSVLTWQDRRAETHGEILRQALEPAPITGSMRLATHVAARALWLRHRAPQRFARAAYALHSGDYLAARLTGRPVTTGGPAETVFAAAGLPVHLLPSQRLAPGEIAGGLTSAAGRTLGLTPGIPVVAGGLDSFLGSVGSGICEPGDVCVNSGSSSVVARIARPPTRGRFELAGQPLVSRVLRVGARHLKRAHALSGSPRTLPELVEEAAQRGSRRTEADPSQLEKMLPDLVTRNDPVETIRRVLETICEAQRRALEDLREIHGPARRIRLVGGLAGAQHMGRFQADILGRPVEVPVETDSSALGAALLAGLATGHFPSLREAGDHMVHVARRHGPGEGSQRASTRAIMS